MPKLKFQIDSDYAKKFFILALGYFVFTLLGLRLAELHHNVSPISPASGFGIVALLFFGKRFAPAVFLGAFLGSLSCGVPVLLCLTLALGKTLEAIAGKYILKQNPGWIKIGDIKQSAFFSYLATCLLAPPISASIEALSLWLAQGGLFWGKWAAIWSSDCVGILIAGPVCQALLRASPRSERKLSFDFFLGVSALAAITVLFRPVLETHVASAYVYFPLLFWMAFRCNELEFTLLTATLAALGLAAEIANVGPFHTDFAERNTFNLQLFLGSYSLTALTIREYGKTKNFRIVYLVFAIFWLLTAGATSWLNQEFEKNRELQFSRLAREAYSHVEAKLATVEQPAKSTQAYFNAQLSPDEKTTERFLRDIGITKTFYGWQGIGRVETNVQLEKWPRLSNDTDLKQFAADAAFHSRLSSPGSPESILYLPPEMGGTPVLPTAYLFLKVNSSSSAMRRSWIYFRFSLPQLLNGVFVNEQPEIQTALFRADSAAPALFSSKPQASIEAKDYPILFPINLWNQPLLMGVSKSPDFPIRNATTSAWIGFLLSCLSIVAAISVASLDSENRRIAQQLAQSRERFQLAIEGSNSGLWDWNVETNEVYFSPVWKTMLGYEDHEIPGSFSAWLKLIHPDDLARAQATLQDYFEGKSKIYYLEHRLQTKCGEYHWVLAKGACIRDHEGKVTRMTGWHIDIHQARQKDVAIKEQSALLQMITSHLGDVIWLTDVGKNKMVYVSDSYAHVWERSCESLYQNPMSFVSAIHSQDRARVIQAFTKQMESNYHEIYRIETPAGGIKWIRDRAFPIRDRNGEIKHIVGIASDITNEIAQEKLIEEQRMRLVNSAKLSSLGEMAGGLAHEINNPIAIILGKAQQLHRRNEAGGVDPAFLRSAAEVIESTCKRVVKIIKGLKALSRNGENDPFTRVSVPAMVENVLEVCRERLRVSNIELKIKVEPDLEMECREAQMGQVLLNLLSNAEDAVIGTENAWIEVAAHTEGERITIFVTDSGSGIPEDVAERIMQPFFTTKEIGKGTGLGLSISNSIIVDHGGTLTLNRNCKNTRFSISMPRLGPESKNSVA